MSAESLTEALKRLASGLIRQDDLSELQQAVASGSITITIASQGGVAVGGNVSGGMVGNFVLPPEVLKLLQQAPYRPAALPPPEKLADRGILPPGSRLPFSPNAVFTGRQEDLIELGQDLLYAHDKSGVVVSGMGGLGKSQLAIEFCYRYGRFFRGVHWIQANLDIQAEIAENGLAMNLPYWPDKLPEQVQATLKAWQEEGGQRLIVLDNAADLQVMQDWLPKLRPARLLITSRRENWPVDMGLNVKKLEVLARSQSIELLRKLAARLKGMPDEHLDNLADFLGDLPLALDLAGRYLADRPELSIEGYLAELKEAGSALEHTSLRDWAEHSPTGHLTSLAATFALSWERLTKDDELAKQLFKIGGYCAPNIPIPRQILAKAMGADVPDHELDRALRKLDSLGLMDSSEGGRRMHSLLAEFARLQDQQSTESVLPALAEAMARMTTKALESGLLENMKPLLEHLEAVSQEAENSELQIKCALLDNLGIALRYLGDYQGARNKHEQALKIKENTFGPDNPETAKTLDNLGIALRYLGDYQGARNKHEQALKIKENTFGLDNPDAARILSNLGIDLLYLSDYEDAREKHEQALKIEMKVYGPDHPDVARILNNLGTDLRCLGYYADAKEKHEQALKIEIKVYGPDHPDVARTLYNLGLDLQYLGDLNEARKYFERALEIFQKKLGEDHPDTRTVAYNLNPLAERIEIMKTELGITMPDENPYSAFSTITVPQSGKIQGLKVRVDITDMSSDLKVALVSPTCKGFMMLWNQEGSDQNNLITTFDPVSTPVLATLIGQERKGNWTLQVMDPQGQHRGRAFRWSLEIA